METRRGTTPHIVCTVEGIELNTLDILWLTLKQGNYTLTKELSDVVIDENKIKIWLTQEETLAFKSGNVFIQLRGRYGNEAVASDIRTFQIEDILRDGIIE